MNAQFIVDNYHVSRADQNQKGGGEAAFLSSDIAGDPIDNALNLARLNVSICRLN